MKPLRLLAAACVIVLTGCAVMSVGSDYAPDTKFSNFHTFAWELTKPLPTGDPRLDDNPFFSSRVRSTVEKQLEDRGLTQNSSNPDLLVHYHMFVQHMDRYDLYTLDTEIDRARGLSIFDKPVEMRVNPYDEGTLLIDIADAGSKQIIWRGWARLDVTDVLDNRNELNTRISEAVKKIIRKYPAG